MIIIPIGSCCEVTYKTEKLEIKNERSLFEWHFSFNFKDIFEVFKKISNEEELIFSTKHCLNVGIDNTDIYTSHYRVLEKYKDIMNRRKQRLIDNIKGDDNVLFIRQITDNGVSVFPTSEEIEEFKSYIYKLNPNCKYKILLVIYTENNIPLVEGVEYLLLKDKENLELWNSKIKEITFL
jgi:hypothetical protein